MLAIFLIIKKNEKKLFIIFFFELIGIIEKQFVQNNLIFENVQSIIASLGV